MSVRGRAFTLVAATWLLPAIALSAEPAPVATPCRIDISPASVPLKELLQHLSRARQFDLHYEDLEDPSIVVAGRHTPEALMERLSKDANIAVRYRLDKRCPRELQIASVWVLPRHLLPASIPTPPNFQPVPAIPSERASVPEGPKAGGPDEDYLRAHGFLPPR
jgi:hypothetical protein